MDRAAALQLIAALCGYAVLVTVPPIVAQHALLARSKGAAGRVAKSSRLGAQILYYAWNILAFAIFGVVIAFVTIPIAGFVVLTLLSVWFISNKLVVLDMLALQRLDKLVAAGNKERAFQLAERIATTTKRLEPNVWSYFCLTASRSVSALDHEQAERLVSRCDDASVVGASSWAIAHAIAIYRVALGRYEEARAILDAREGEAPTPELGEQRLLLGARIDASTGKASRALEIAKKKEGSDWDAIRAHAFAAQGKSDEAREALLRIKADQGMAALQQIADRKGPAAAIAASLTQATAYR